MLADPVRVRAGCRASVGLGAHGWLRHFLLHQAAGGCALQGLRACRSRAFSAVFAASLLGAAAGTGCGAAGAAGGVGAGSAANAGDSSSHMIITMHHFALGLISYPSTTQRPLLHTCRASPDSA